MALLLGYNSSLLSPFLELMEVVAQWYKGVMEHHECCWKEGFLFLLDHTHALSSIPPDNISISHDDKLSKIYDLTNMAREHQELAQLLLDEVEFGEAFLECVFKFAETTNAFAESHVRDFFSGNLRALITLMGHSYDGLEGHFITLLMQTVKTFAKVSPE